jgi:hypothetical protein
MIKIILTITLFLISLISIGQVFENREVSDFSKLEVSNAIEVFYTISNTKKVTVSTDDNENLQYIKTVVIDGTLKLFVDTENKKDKIKNKYSKNSNVIFVNGISFKFLKINISGPSLKSINAESSAAVKIENTNTSPNLDIAVSSSASVSGNFKTTNLFIDVSSSGEISGTINSTLVEIKSSSASDVKLSGEVSKIIVKASSSSTCNLKDLLVEDATIHASSSADVTLKSLKSIEAKASSTASIVYYVSPTRVKEEVSSSGSISKK